MKLENSEIELTMLFAQLELRLMKELLQEVVLLFFKLQKLLSISKLRTLTKVLESKLLKMHVEFQPKLLLIMQDLKEALL